MRRKAKGHWRGMTSLFAKMLSLGYLNFGVNPTTESLVAVLVALVLVAYESVVHANRDDKGRR